ncbi:MAG: hypothetical protein KAT58_01950 [candidate division Zixibacteria bacterium]|nr:hypothetical protein [candidate division Zixibacteria bacterium]
MRRIVLFGLVLFVLLTAPLTAQFLGQMHAPRALGLGSLNLTAAVGAYEDAFTLIGRARYGVTSQMDLTCSFGIVDFERTDDLDLVLGGDLQYQLTHYDLGRPLDMAVGGFIKYYSNYRPGNYDRSDYAVGMNFITGRPIDFPSGFCVIPYGEMNVRIDSREQNGTTDSDFNIGFNLGVEIPLSGYVDFVSEVQLDDQFGIIVAVNFLMW